MGYADGLFRTLSGKMEMLVRGRRVPQIGSICMDISVIDVSAVPDVKKVTLLHLLEGMEMSPFVQKNLLIMQVQCHTK